MKIIVGSKPISQLDWNSLNSKGDLEYDTDEKGSVTASESFTVLHSEHLDYWPSPGVTLHPGRPGLVVQRHKYRQGKGGFGQLTLFSKGWSVRSDGAVDEAALPAPKISGGFNRETVPIDAHPDFESFAGTAAEPNTTNGAVFDAEEPFKFVGFLDQASPYFARDAFDTWSQYIRYEKTTSIAPDIVAMNAMKGRLVGGGFLRGYLSNAASVTLQIADFNWSESSGVFSLQWEFKILDGPNFNLDVAQVLYGRKTNFSL